MQPGRDPLTGNARSAATERRRTTPLAGLLATHNARVKAGQPSQHAEKDVLVEALAQARVDGVQVHPIHKNNAATPALALPVPSWPPHDRSKAAEYSHPCSRSCRAGPRRPSTRPHSKRRGTWKSRAIGWRRSSASCATLARRPTWAGGLSPSATSTKSRSGTRRVGRPLPSTPWPTACHLLNYGCGAEKPGL